MPAMNGSRPADPARSLSIRIAPPERSPEFALRDAQREIAAEVAASTGWSAADAVVIERDGRALALTGTPGSGKSVLAAHFLARGWKLLTDDIAFLDPKRSVVVAHHGLMSFRSGAIPNLPSAFRTTLERSRWFVSEDGDLQFYEVDPEFAFRSAWSQEAVLDSVIILHNSASAGRVETLDRESMSLCGFDGSPLGLDAFSDLRVGIIGRDRVNAMVDRIEHWYDAHANAVPA
jgi:hypothetical protein